MTVNKEVRAPETTFRLGVAPLYTKAEVDQAVIGAVEEMQSEIETLRNALVRLAVFVDGDPCWCKCEDGKHSKVCRDILKLKLWPRPSGSKSVNRDHLPWR